MKKSILIEEIVKEVVKIECYVARVYGVSCGVGYDLDVYIEFYNGSNKHIEAHAVRQSWACVNHLRPRNPMYKYSGSNDVYQDQVIKYWTDGKAFSEYLARDLKKNLEVMLWELEEQIRV